MRSKVVNISPSPQKPPLWPSYPCCPVPETTYNRSESDHTSKASRTTSVELLNCGNFTWNTGMEGPPSKTLFIKRPYPYGKSISLSDGFHNICCRGSNHNLWETLKVPLRIGSLLCVIPNQGLSQRKDSFKWIHCGTLISTFVTMSLILHTFCISYNFVVQMLTAKNSARDLILGISGVWFYSAGTLVYMFFLLRAKQLSQFFQTWKETSLKISHCLMPNQQLERNVALITAAILVDCIGENILFHFHLLTSDQRKSLNTLTLTQFLQDYYGSNQYMSRFFDYSPYIVSAMLITNKLATIAWNFGDTILILMALVLHERFWALNEYIRLEVDLQSKRKGSTSWASIRSTFLQLTGLLKEANKQFSPLIWLSCTTDVFFICRQLYEGLLPVPFQTSSVNKIYLVWSLFHLIGRTLGVNLMASAMSEEAHRTFKVIQQCHPSDYNEEVRRLEIFLGGRIIGISGSGCFIITRSFVTMIISAIFTLEVVLLQNSNVTVGWEH